MYNRNRYRPLIFVGGALLLFVAFLCFLIGIEGNLKDAQQELLNVNGYQQIRQLWFDKHASLGRDEQWIENIGEKLSKLKLTNSEKSDLDTWYPFKTELNLVVIPDYSSRLYLRNQIEYDKDLVSHIWESFTKFCIKGKKNESRIILEVTDPKQADGKLSDAKTANNLIIDLASSGNKPSKIYLTEEQTGFYKAVDVLYKQGESKISGADYKRFIDVFLPQNEKKSTLSKRFKNKLIILTDGYLELTNGPYYTGNRELLANVRKEITQGNEIGSVLKRNNLRIPLDSSVDLSNWEILLLEIRERENGDYEVLRYLWKEWLEGMGANVEFQIHLDASRKVKEKIDEFIFEDEKDSYFSGNKLNLKNTEPNAGQRQTSQITKTPNSENCPEQVYNQLLKEGEALTLKGDYSLAEIKFGDVQKLLDKHDCLDQNKVIELQKNFTQKAEQFCKAYKNQPTLKYIPNNYYKMAAILQKQKPKQCL